MNDDERLVRSIYEREVETSLEHKKRLIAFVVVVVVVVAVVVVGVVDDLFDCYCCSVVDRFFFLHAFSSVLSIFWSLPGHVSVSVYLCIFIYGEREKYEERIEEGR